MKKIGNDSVVSSSSQRISAIKKHLGAKDEIFVNGEQVKAADLVQAFQDALDTRAAAVTAKGEYKSALAARQAADVRRVTVDAALQPYVVNRFGPSSPEAHDFGYAARKVGAKTAVNKAKAALLGKATREARGTTGKKAKQQIKGTLSPEAAAALEALSGSATATSPAPVATVASVSAATSAPSTPVAEAPAVVTNGATLHGEAHS